MKQLHCCWKKQICCLCCWLRMLCCCRNHFTSPWHQTSPTIDNDSHQSPELVSEWAQFSKTQNCSWNYPAPLSLHHLFTKWKSSHHWGWDNQSNHPHIHPLSTHSKSKWHACKSFDCLCFSIASMWIHIVVCYSVVYHTTSPSSITHCCNFQNTHTQYSLEVQSASHHNTA